MIKCTYRLLTRDEEREAWRRWREQGDRDAYDLLAQSQFPWVRRLAGKRLAHLGRRGDSALLDLLEAEGLIALARALRYFDPDRGRLTTVTAKCVMSQWSRCDLGGPMYVPPTTSERRRDLARRAKRPASIVNRWDEETLGVEPAVDDDPSDTLADREEATHSRALVDWAMSQLPQRQRLVMRRRRWDGLTLEQVCEELGVTKERVRQIEAKALARLTSLLENPPNPLPAAHAALPIEEFVMEENHRPQPESDVMAALAQISQGQLEREIGNLQQQRDALASQFDAKIEKLTKLRNALFGSPAKAARANQRGKRGPEATPREGSKNRQIWELLKTSGPLTTAAIEERLGLDAGSIGANLSAATGKWFERTGPGTYAAIVPDAAAVA